MWTVYDYENGAPSHVDLATLIHMTMTFEGDQFTWTFSPPLDRLTRMSGEYELLTDTRMLSYSRGPWRGNSCLSTRWTPPRCCSRWQASAG